MDLDLGVGFLIVVRVVFACVCVVGIKDEKKVGLSEYLFCVFESFLFVVCSVC